MRDAIRAIDSGRVLGAIVRTAATSALSPDILFPANSSITGIAASITSEAERGTSYKLLSAMPLRESVPGCRPIRLMGENQSCCTAFASCSALFSKEFFLGFLFLPHRSSTASFSTGFKSATVPDVASLITSSRLKRCSLLLSSLTRRATH